MQFFDVAALLIVLAAAFGTLNHLFLKLPSSIGILLVTLIASLLVLGLDLVFPQSLMAEAMRTGVTGLNFSKTLLDGMLGLLLFAGAMHVKISDLRAQAGIVVLMATLGVLISTLVVGVGLWAVAGVPLMIALVFGALISPTDPVAVLGVLRITPLPQSLETKIAGESLFNDGVGYVVFLILAGLAFPAEDASETAGSALDALRLFAHEAGGGALVGGVLGWLTFKLMSRIDDSSLTVLITLALAFGGYALANQLGVSAPIMAVVAGLIVGEVMTERVIPDAERANVDTFWQLIDEVLNAILFMMIGLEIFAVTFTGAAIQLALVAVALSLVGRLVSVVIPLMLVHRGGDAPIGQAAAVMTWGGLKGGISVALVLSLPPNAWTDPLLTATYVVVVFSILVQGLTVAPLARRLSGDATSSDTPNR